MFGKKQILREIKYIKTQPFGKLKVRCKFGKITYFLLPLTDECVNDNNIIKLLAEWRKKSEYWFLKQFKVSLKGTGIWLQNNVITTPDRILFMIKVKGKFIGHIGLFRFDFNKLTCEIDNVIRGFPDHPGIMENSIRHLMAWGKKQLHLKNFSLETTSDNLRSQRLYRRLGFVETKKVALIYVNRKEYNEWIVAPKNYKEEVKRYNVFMKLDK